MFPLMAPMTDEIGILELSNVRYPYKVYYELKGDEEVWVIHIRDTRRSSWGRKGRCATTGGAKGAEFRHGDQNRWYRIYVRSNS
jgi:hypothetical protein